MEDNKKYELCFVGLTTPTKDRCCDTVEELVTTKMDDGFMMVGDLIEHLKIFDPSRPIIMYSGEHDGYYFPFDIDFHSANCFIDDEIICEFVEED